MAKILVIEDEPNVLIALRDSLESEGYRVSTATDGNEGLRLASVEADGDAPDLIMLDLMLPKMSGLEVCQRLRAAGVETPVIMLTARGAASDAAFGLKLGADDYIPKPFDVGELLARVEAVLRRAKRPPTETKTIKIGDVELDFRRLRANKRGEPLDISPREFEILQFLIAHVGETVTREQLLHHIWGEHASLYTRTIDAHITRLRHKLEPTPGDPQHIITVHRVGYRLVADFA
ncbi:MAG: response regulator transcription factor [Acidobacteriota bacterium]|nr:response regulator transcription factor [Acidobacteriota bacterium]